MLVTSLKYSSKPLLMGTICGEKTTLVAHTYVDGTCSCGYIKPQVNPNPNPPSNPDNPPLNPDEPSPPENNDTPSDAPKDNTGTIIAISVAGAVVVAGGGAGTFFFIRKRKLK